MDWRFVKRLDRAAEIFDATEPRRHADGSPVCIPFERWSRQTQDHFLALAALNPQPKASDHE